MGVEAKRRHQILRSPEASRVRIKGRGRLGPRAAIDAVASPPPGRPGPPPRVPPVMAPVEGAASRVGVADPRQNWGRPGLG